MFYGGVVKAGKPAVFVPPPDEHSLHLSQASLPADVKVGTRASLQAKVQDDDPVILATLCAGGLDSVALDLFFSEYTEFSVVGGADIHISGYYSPQIAGEASDEESEEAEEDEEYGDHPTHITFANGDDEMRQQYADAFETDEEEEGESDEEEEDDDEDEDEGEASDEDEDMEDMMPFGRSRKPDVVIEDITDAHKEVAVAAAKDVKALVQRSRIAGQSQQQAANQGAEGDESDEGESEEEEDEEAAPAKQQQPAAAPAKAVAKAAATAQKQQPQQKQQQKQQQHKQQQQEQVAAGTKRKADSADTPASKKQATAAVAPAKQQGADAKTPAKQQQANGTKAPAKEQVKDARTPAKQADTAPPQAAEDDVKAGPVSAGKKKGVRRYENGFEVHEQQMGAPNGKLAKAGKRVAVRYVGRLKSNGKVFDKTTGKPFTFRLGVGEVIKGWDAGVEGMRVGDKRKLIIPPQMGYGNQKTGPIPPGSWLEFDVELVDVK